MSGIANSCNRMVPAEHARHCTALEILSFTRPLKDVLSRVKVGLSPISRSWRRH